MADPSDEDEGTGVAPRPAAGRQPCDPPEVGRPTSFELPHTTAGWHRAKSRRILAFDHAEDHHLEFEIEGLVPPANEPSPRHQFPRRVPRSFAGQALSSVLASWSVAWSPRHRIKSGFCLILAAFVLLVHFGPGGDGSLLGRSSSKGGGRKADPLGNLSNEQRISLLKEVYGTWTFYDGSAEDRPRTPYVTEENAGNRFLDLPEDKFPPESWQADAGETQIDRVPDDCRPLESLGLEEMEEKDSTSRKCM